MLIADLAQLFLDDVKTRASFARMSRRSLIVSISSLYSLDDLLALQPGELIEAKIEDLIGLMFAEGVTAFRQSGFGCESGCRSARPVSG